MSNLPDSFRLIFNDSPLGVAVVLQTGDGTLDNAMLLYANPALLQLIQHKDPDNFDFISIIAELCTDEEGRSLLPLPEDPNDMKSIFVRITLCEEKSIWVEVRAQPTAILGERAHFFWFTDVTETKEQETIARREAAAADAAAQAKSAFLATMSHEIRTPMQTIFGMLELMKDEDSYERMLDMINSAQGSANSLLGILDDILDLAKVDAGKMELDQFDMPIRVLLNGLIDSMESKRRENNLYLTSDFSDDVPEIIIGDSKRLRQILINLLNNGLKFTEQGGVTLRVTTKTKYITPKDNQVPLRFEIIDTGIGMTHETASRLFQPFTQADNSTTRKFGGTGLGLSIAHRLVELMGGQIGVISEAGHGSTFWFEIPTHKTSASTFVDLPDLTGLSVLVIEDNPASQADLVASLQHMKADVTAVGGAMDAIDLVKKRPFDVAIVDYGLPDMDGMHLLRRLHDLRPFMGLILHTVQSDYAVLQSCKFVGARYLEKPSSRFNIGEAVKGAAKRIRPQTVKQQRLLVCEDNESVRDIIQRQLSKLGITADYVENGLLGWELIQQGQHTVIITDLHMPHMDGYGLIKAVREYENENQVGKADRLPVIAMTADVQLVHHQVYLQQGFDECLLKPVSIGQLKQLLMRWGVIQETASLDNPSTQSPAPPLIPAYLNNSIADLNLPNLPVVDRKLAVELFGVFDHDTVDLIKMFIQISIPQIAEMQRYYDEKQWTGLKNMAHSLKGAARSACCLQLGQVAEKIQNLSENGQVDDHCMQQLQVAFEKAGTEVHDLEEVN
jgi:two-component system sensor histidine kinase/response regulator